VLPKEFKEFVFLPLQTHLRAVDLASGDTAVDIAEAEVKRGCPTKWSYNGL
jgi:hypothetical protein